MIRQRKITSKTALATLTYAEMGDVVANGSFELTLPDSNVGLWYMITNIGTGIVTVGGTGISPVVSLDPNEFVMCYSNGTSGWYYGKSWNTMTKAEIEAVLTGEITTHTHAITHVYGLNFYVDGELNVGTKVQSLIVPKAMTITEIRLVVDTAPTDASLIIDINKNGTTLYTTQANRPTITTGNTSATATAPDITSVAVGDLLTLEIDQVGSTLKGENLSVVIICSG